MRTRLAYLLAAAAAALALQGPAAAAVGPKALCKALLATPLPRAGTLHPVRPATTTPSARAQRHHVVCEVEIGFSSGSYALFFIVFPSRADALANYREGVAGATSALSKIPVRDLPQPAVSLSGVSNGAGATTVGFVSGNVGVAAVTVNTSFGSKRGNPVISTRIARLAVPHLKKLAGTR